MKEPPKEERDQLLLVLHTVTACDDILRICEQMEKDRIDSNHPFHDALMNSMVALLVRPFKRNNGLGKADITLWPATHNEHLESFQILRDKFHMHTDKNGTWNDKKTNHFIRKVSDFGQLCWIVKNPLVIDVKLIKNITSEMRQTCQYRITKFEKKYLLGEIRPGFEYAIDFDDGPFFGEGGGSAISNHRKD